jgi:hypothetical protein
LVHMYKTERLNIIDYHNIITLMIEAANSWKPLSPLARVMLLCTTKSHKYTRLEAQFLPICQCAYFTTEKIKNTLIKFLLGAAL